MYVPNTEQVRVQMQDLSRIHGLWFAFCSVFTNSNRFAVAWIAPIPRAAPFEPEGNLSSRRTDQAPKI